MQKGHQLEFACLACQTPILFSPFSSHVELLCPRCNKVYRFEDPILVRQLKKFEALCRQVHDSKEILGEVAVGIDVGDRHVKIPYKLLLTRFNTTLDLLIEGKPLTILFRMEPDHHFSNPSSEISSL